MKGIVKHRDDITVNSTGKHHSAVMVGVVTDDLASSGDGIYGYITAVAKYCVEFINSGSKSFSLYVRIGIYVGVRLHSIGKYQLL